MNAAASGRVPSPARLTPGARVGGVAVSAAIRVTAIAEVYQADGPNGPVTLHVVHPALARDAKVRAAILAAAQRAKAAPANPHLVPTLAAGVEGESLFVITEALDGSTVKDLLARKRQAGGGGFGARGAGNLLIGVAAGLGAGGIHGALSTDSVVVSRSGKVRVADLALGAGTAVAMASGLIPGASHVAPEVAKSGTPSAEGDVYGLGALLYEALVGKPLERGGPRPSDAVAGLTTTVDELIARACAATPDRRFGSIEVVKELVADALAHGAAVDEPVAAAASGPIPAARPSLAHAIATPTATPEMSAAVSGALGAAIADGSEKWLIAKGRLDYGPFSLADVVAQIKKGDIVAGNVIIDKDTGGRVKVQDHPLLGPIVDAAKQHHDDQRRAHAEVAHQSRERKRGVILYGGIGLAVVGVGLVVWLIIDHTVNKKDSGAVAGVEKVGAAELSVTFSQPTRPPPVKHTGPKHSGGGGGHSGGGGDNGDDETLALDMSGGDDDDDSGSETLTMDQIYGTYSRYGRQLAGCMSKAGESNAHIAISVDGKSGKVNFVRVNGQKGGGLAECIGSVMRSMDFPKVNGTRTRAEFDINL